MGGSTTTKSENTPWKPAEGYITDSLRAAQNANNKGTAFIDSNEGGINAALSRLQNNAITPPQYVTDARTQLNKTINGDFIGRNPHTSGLADLIAQKTGAQYNSTFGAAGRARGGLAAMLQGQGVGDALQQFYSDQYGQERGMQQQAIMAAPAFNADEATATNSYLNAVSGAATLPGQVAGNYANTITNASSPYVQNTTTQTEKPGALKILSTGLGLAAQIGGAAMTGGASLGMSGLLKGGGMMMGGQAAPKLFGRFLG